MTTEMLPVTERTRIRRLRERQVYDRAVLNAILDSGLVAHVALCIDGAPALLPVAYARDGDRLLLHGSTGAGLLRAAAGGAPIAVAVTHLDGLVFARSIFDSSMNYRSAVVFGTARVLEGDERVHALRALSDHLMPGRWDEVRPPTNRELAATLVLALSLDEVSVKVRTGGPSAEDGADPNVWAGVLPLGVRTAEPVPADDLPPGVAPPQSLHAVRRRHSTAPHPTDPTDNEGVTAMSLASTPQSYLARLGARVAADGLSAHSADVLVLADAALAVAPAAAAVLGDDGQPEVARQRALAVASSAVLRSRAAAESFNAVLTAAAVGGMELTAA